MSKLPINEDWWCSVWKRIGHLVLYILNHMVGKVCHKTNACANMYNSKHYSRVGEMSPPRKGNNSDLRNRIMQHSSLPFDLEIAGQKVITLPKTCRNNRNRTHYQSSCRSAGALYYLFKDVFFFNRLSFQATRVTATSWDNYNPV